MGDEPSRESGQFILNSLFAIRYSLFPHPSPTRRYAMDGAPAADTVFDRSYGRGPGPLNPRDCTTDTRTHGRGHGPVNTSWNSA